MPGDPAYIDCGGLSGVYGRSDQSRREVSLATKKGLVTTSDDHNSDAMLLSVPSSSFHFSPRQTTGSYSLLTNGSPGVLSRQVEKRVQISSPPQPRAFSFRASLACSSASYAVRWRNCKRTISIRALTRHIRLNHFRNIRINLLLLNLRHLQRNLHLLQLMMHIHIELQPMSLAQQLPSSTVASSPS
ncbi:hypothetical protein Q3G72_011242 [Acer saccharum]|nr:hypothetical protein Q3G72_011242 [Acer saccharum]